MLIHAYIVPAALPKSGVSGLCSLDFFRLSISSELGAGEDSPVDDLRFNNNWGQFVGQANSSSWVLPEKVQQKAPDTIASRT